MKVNQSTSIGQMANTTISMKFIQDHKSPLKIFVQEDDRSIKQKITEELKMAAHEITFFSKSDSIFDLLLFNPDVLIMDYSKNKIINRSLYY